MSQLVAMPHGQNCGQSESMKGEPSNFSLSVSHQSSKIVAVSSKLSWKIEQFERLTRLYKNNKSLVSERFFSSVASNVVWELHVYPNGKREEDCGYVSFFLRQIGLEHTNDSLLADFQIYIVDSSGTTMSICRDAKEFTNQQGRGKFQVGRDRLMHLIHPDGVLHLCCDVEYLPLKSCSTTQEQKIWEPSMSRAMAVRETMSALYNESILTDVEIYVNGQTFKAHRCILARASDVFNSMFVNEMLEASEGIIRLMDSTPQAVRGMLEYMYMGTIDRVLFEKNARDILVIAQKYNIVPLKEECEQYLGDGLTIRNFSALVSFADLYSCDNLMEFCRKFLVLNYDQITHSHDWMALKKKQTAVVNDLLEKSLQDKIQGTNTRSKSAGVPSDSLDFTTHFSHNNIDDSCISEPTPKRPRRRVANAASSQQRIVSL